MRRILLDTSAYSALQRGNAGVLDAVQLAEEVFLNPITQAELLTGFRRGTRFEENRRQLHDFLSAPPARLVSIDEETAEFYALILADLLSLGRPVRTNDVWIAASAMQHGLGVLTTDRHFEGIRQIRSQIIEA